MATKKAVVPKRSIKKGSVAPKIMVPPLVFSPPVTKSKKAVVKSTSKKAVLTKKTTKKPEIIVVEEVTLGAKESLKLPMEVSKEYVVVHRCTNCEHIPFSLTRLVTLFSVLIMLLSVSVLIQVGAIDLSGVIAFFSPVALAASDLLK